MVILIGSWETRHNSHSAYHSGYCKTPIHDCSTCQNINNDYRQCWHSAKLTVLSLHFTCVLINLGHWACTNPPEKPSSPWGVYSLKPGIVKHSPSNRTHEPSLILSLSTLTDPNLLMYTEESNYMLCGKSVLRIHSRWGCPSCLFFARWFWMNKQKYCECIWRIVFAVRIDFLILYLIYVCAPEHVYKMHTHMEGNM